MPRVIILRGPYCSGKTTWALKFINNNKNSIVVSKKDIIKSVKGSLESTKIYLIAKKVETEMIKSSMEEGLNIIIDEELFLKSQLDSTIETINLISTSNEKIKNNKYSVEIKIFDKTPLEICLARNSQSLNPKKERAIQLSYEYFHKKK